ncbi:MAG: AmmeMemoRadiSam system protein B [Sulfurimonas sp. RIFOXYD12_FULL_33_39]|uniref:AmmeMemoRadiSam system protein B n=1 Tax=unclassified Sulfurimonas TaxID=2623549 RepID=UPI0008BE3753|nr:MULTISPECIES: AmmeMemoRadiSam system protein B [unclassified Sulfurimonas]OHE06778.1 MAG: AmmeMemoRadiSam system protein B [Sulfurimonas sp. RIFCSPLOWO2_12_FULL_34_6]OHE09732.1 MAG: AmmeMemoRadiSam system protein B [Sulfurimonas sp. RIFOXYD12_FULL_33_39]OHE13760.1 MAG: AmmeMemoRadiSam system protein B [Sulfurimonas sp. RIFOXYD2_FULL_34_21]DAB28684.1 MAG TPA: AmmeMemoRadiSam system protein B [Sulfurimonas sp. UBA10385]
MTRKMSVAGTFYPARAVELERYFEHFNAAYDEDREIPAIKSRLVIVPHAGYIYSGYTANIAYRVLQNSGVKTFVVIGPSHRVAYTGVSLCDFSAYDTPFGEIKPASELVEKLKSKFSFVSLTQAHAEHSTEVQFPFLKHYIEGVSLVELIYSYADAKYISKIINYLLEQDDIGVIISSDLSHFHTLEEANRIDNICVKAIEKLDIDILYGGCEACGNIGIEAAILSAKKLGLSSHVLDYRTSADASNDTTRVVGYVSACFYE